MALMYKLLVVESPTKAKTISKYLGSDFKVLATVGHLRDLPKKKMGVDLKNDFEPDYEISSDKKGVVRDLIAGAKKASEILLATDPDREGEAISWHVRWILEDQIKSKLPGIKRVTFHEITKEAVSEALKGAREIDLNLVDAQQGRRVLDRVVGYHLSPVLWRKVRRGLSGGRVQSVAVRLICEREKEIEAFKSEKFFRVWGQLRKGETFEAELIRVGGVKVEVSQKIKLFDGNYTYTKSIFTDKGEVEKFVESLKENFKVEKVEGKEILRTPLPAFTTSKLQQMASRRFGWSAKQTMSLAQRLYEQGLITYHRTDSVYLAEKAVGEFRNFIGEKYGKEYLSAKVRVYRNTAKNAQEAHEAIRPTKAEIEEPGGLDSKELKLYQIIWRRAVATQAAAAKLENTTVVFSNGTGTFVSKGVRMLFDGFLKISGDKHEDQILPALIVGEEVKSQKIRTEEVETNPPPRYTDASLVGSLEKQGIGRPSTYAPIISTIQLRQYVEKDEGKFRPTALGKAANEFLVNNFVKILSLPFTAEMEEKLDEIALGKLGWRKMMKAFWDDFGPVVKKAETDGERVKVETEKLNKSCPECKVGQLVIRVGRFGKFISCDRFPECKYSAQYQEEAGFKCPECGALGVVKRTKTGKKFYGCSQYPECKWAGWKKP